MASRRYQVLVTHSELPEIGLNILNRLADVTICQSMPVTRQEILSKCEGVHGILWACSEMLDEEILQATGPMLKTVSSLFPTVDNIDVAQLQCRRITLGHTKSAGNEARADLAIGLMITAARRFREVRLSIEMSKIGHPHPGWMLGRDIRGSIVGFIGFSHVGQTIAKRLRGFDIHKILYNALVTIANQCEFNATFATFETVLKQSDYVFITCPLTDATKGMFNEHAFNMMKPTSVLINIARAQIVDQSALYTALSNDKIFAAGVDVVNPEPFPTDEYLLTLPNFILTPNLATASREAADSMALLAARNLAYGLMDMTLPSPVYELRSMLVCEESGKYFYDYYKD